jgi:preprotein translocase subunit SecD
MNRFPLWKYILIGIVLVVSFIYTLPNFYGEVPAVQVSPVKSTEKADEALLRQAQAAVQAAAVKSDSAFIDGNSVKLRFASTDDQIRAKDAIQAALGNRYTVALNLLSASPQWLTSINALPMYLGLDLRGGVHFLLEVDMKAALE